MKRIYRLLAFTSAGIAVLGCILTALKGYIAYSIILFSSSIILTVIGLDIERD